MKIAIDCHTLEIKNWAGKEQYLYRVLQELTKVDQQNEYVLYFRKPVFERPLAQNCRIKNVNLPTPLWQFYVVLDLLFTRIDVLFAPSAYLLPAINFFVPAILVIYDLTTFLPKIKKTHKLATRWREKLLLWLAVKNSKKIIVISKNTKKDLIEFFHPKPEKISVIYPAGHPHCKVIENQNLIREGVSIYNLTYGFFLFVGTLEPRKNLIRLIEAYHILNFKFKIKNSKLIIVGKKGWFYQQIFRKVKELRLEDKVVFLGYVPDENLPYLYNAATCFVYPSLYEGFGLPVLEAISCGCPVITSNISSLPEVVGEAAILVDPYNVNEIALALKKISTDENLRYYLKERGLKQAQKFSWQKTAQEIWVIFKAIKSNQSKNRI